APEERADTAVMAPTHEIRRQANRAIREGLADDGTLHGRVLPIDRLVPRRLTRALAADIASYEPGDTLVFHRDVFGCAKDDVCTVTAVADGTVVLAHPDGGERRFRPSGNAAYYFGLYDTEPIELRAGDRIRWTRNRKARPPRFGHPPSPHLVNGSEAEIVEIGSRRVRFRDGDREFGLALDDPQLRHLDHAYCTTVHAAQGRTATAAIAVLDAGGAADREMFHVEISRVREDFLLLTDDREALIELLEGRDGGGDGALEALGIDPGSVSPGTSPGQAGAGPAAPPPAVEPEIFAALAADWRALKERAEETGTVPFFLPGYREVVARAAALGTGDLSAGMRGLVDAVLEEHRDHLARDREIAALVGRIQAHWRRWPELAWADRAPHRAEWREQAEALVGEARGRLAGAPDGDDTALHLSAMPGGRGGLAAALAGLERTRLRDDARRFGEVWDALRERARTEGLPESLLPGYAEIAELGQRLDEAGLDHGRDSAVAEWRAVHDEQAALAETVRTLPERVAAWRARRVDPGTHDPAAAATDADRAAWRRDGAGLGAEARAMLRPDDAHAPYVDAAPGASASLTEAADAVRDALADDRLTVFNRLAREVKRRQEETGIEPRHLPGYGETVSEARALDRLPGLADSDRRVLGTCLEYDHRSALLCREIEAWPGRADALRNGHPASGAAPEELADWRERAGPLLAEAGAMTAGDSAHRPHLDAMTEERAAIGDAARRLDAAIAEAEWMEIAAHVKSANDFVRENGGIPYYAPTHGALVERARSLDARPDLPEDRRESVGKILAADELWADERERVGAFLDAAGKVETARAALAGRAVAAPPARRPRQAAEQLPEWDGWRAEAGRVLDDAGKLGNIPRPALTAHLAALGAAPDEIAAREERIHEAVERDERARAETARREAEQDRIAARRDEAEPAARESREVEARAARSRRARATGREAGTEAARERGPARERDVAQRPSREERQAARLAQRLDDCLARRDALLERAEARLLSTEPVSALGLSHKRWRRDARRAVEAGRELLKDPRNAPHLDALGGRERIEAGVGRLEQASTIDGMPARMAVGWEALQDRVRQTGRHRFFLPEHEKLCRTMSDYDWCVKDTGASHFIRGELDLRETMTRQAERIDRVAGTLRESIDKRAGAEKSEVPFVRQPDYGAWRGPAEHAVHEAREMLRDRTYGVQFEHSPGLRDTLRNLSDTLDRPLRAERAEWENIERQRIATEHRQSLSRGRGMSW
ncbi:MAG: hypothetical protein OYH76_05480, partial [Defluviicoccus sp.]|nr:hypothetical protein [Defluviicoccus sp.]MDE0275327.1 hypothetical protein [Defluviicoccus sp.]